MRALVLSTALVFGCVSGDGDAGGASAKDAGRDTNVAIDGAIFPVDDSAVADDAADEAGEAAVDATAPSCGVPGKPCCAGDACGAGSYCNTALCWALPTAVEETSDPGGCGDLGKAHPAPAFVSRYTIRGRPGAKAYRYFVKVSCGSAPPSLAGESPLTIGVDGTYTFTISTGAADTDCKNANLGRYEVWFVVDGQETKHQFASYFNSTCTTCAAAATLCP